MTMRTMITKAPSLLLVLLGAGCGGGQTGDLSGNHQENGGGTVSSGCEDQLQAVLADDDAALGFSATNVLAFATQPFAAPVAWQAVNGVHYTPGPGRSQLSLSLTPTGEVSLVHSIPRASTGEGPALGVVCPPDRLRIPMHAELSTDDGALVEAFETRIEASDPAFATIDQTLDASKLSGAFAVQSIDASALFPGVGGTPELSRLAFQATLSPAGTAGVLSAQVSSRGKEVSGATTFSFAVFPSDSACTPAPGETWSIPVAADDPSIGLTGSEAVADVNAQSPVPLTWSDGSTTSLRVKVSGLAQGCLQSPPLGGGSSGPSISYPVTIELTTEDGKLTGAYSTRLQVERATGSGFTRRLSVHGEYGLSDVEDTGFADVTIPNGTQRLSVAIQLNVTEAAASGSLALNGLVDPPCLTTPPPAMGNSVPGCAGTTVSPLIKGTWGSLEP